MVDLATICPGCMSSGVSEVTCPQCGYVVGEDRNVHALPERTVLQDRFFLGRLLGRPGGYGLTYLAWDLTLEITVAIKEYLPQRLAARNPGATTIVANSEVDQTTFDEGLREFLDEARVLVRFQHQNIARVRDFFEENNTAYLVMEYYEGMSLAERFVEQRRLFSADEAVGCMARILDGLQTVHEDGYLHRDIKPANIYITEDETPILLDFGAARHALGEETESLTVILTPGFAPFEQYLRRGKQGPWSDIYSVGATLYFLLSGTKPPPALDRQDDDELEALIDLNGELPLAVNDAVMQALAVDPASRPQSAKAFATTLRAAIANADTERFERVDKSKSRVSRTALGVALLVIVLSLGGWWFSQPSHQDLSAAPTDTQAEPALEALAPVAKPTAPPTVSDAVVERSDGTARLEVPFPRRRPPPEAVEACVGQRLGDVCEINAPHGFITGECVQMREDFACRPNRGPGGPGGLGPPPRPRPEGQ
ncbi:MAG: serine/threonine-protein kinase [Pseudomonadota bacterium]